mgnify:CR=1 FL=1
MKVNIKPLSVNKVWQGRRYKTKDYKVYEEALFYLLKKYKIPKAKTAPRPAKAKRTSKTEDDGIMGQLRGLFRKKAS